MSLVLFGSRAFAVAPSSARAQLLWSWETPADVTQGSSFLATLGFEAESRWDSPFAAPG